MSNIEIYKNKLGILFDNDVSIETCNFLIIKLYLSRLCHLGLITGNLDKFDNNGIANELINSGWYIGDDDLIEVLGILFRVKIDIGSPIFGLVANYRDLGEEDMLNKINKMKDE